MSGTAAPVVPWAAAVSAQRRAEIQRYLHDNRDSASRVLQRFDDRFNVPNRYRGITIATSEHTLAMEAVREALECDDQCVVLAGPTGVGKTHAGVAACHEQALHSAAGLVVWSTMGALARSFLGEHRDVVAQGCLDADLVVVDDVGGGTYVKEGGLVESLFEEIVCSREGNGLPMIMTTNLTVATFGQFMGDRIADRLRGDWGRWVSLPGQSLRAKRGRRG
jgi:DNA replication protein DnaC